jgi:cytochrome c oxidase subunit 2
MGFPEDISPSGYLVDQIFYWATYCTGIAFAVVVAALIYFMIRYRHRPGHRAHYTHGNSRAALTLTLVLAAVVFFGIDVHLAVRDHYAWEAVWGSPPDENEALRVQVYAQQFAWNVRYPGIDDQFGTDDDVVTINQFHVPVNKPVIMQLRSKDVIHSLFMPNLRVKQDVLPGLTTSMYIQATKTGAYDVACAELCGLEHYSMSGVLTVESEDEFINWMKTYLETYGEDEEDDWDDEEEEEAEDTEVIEWWDWSTKA